MNTSLVVTSACRVYIDITAAYRAVEEKSPEKDGPHQHGTSRLQDLKHSHRIHDQTNAQVTYTIRQMVKSHARSDKCSSHIHDQTNAQVTYTIRQMLKSHTRSNKWSSHIHDQTNGQVTCTIRQMLKSHTRSDKCSSHIHDQTNGQVTYTIRQMLKSHTRSDKWSSHIHDQTNAQVTGTNHSVSAQYWANVADAGPILNQHRVNVSCLLGKVLRLDGDETFLFLLNRRDRETNPELQRERQRCLPLTLGPPAQMV